VEWQEIPNEEVAIHSLWGSRNDRMDCQEMTEARLECKEPTSPYMKACHEVMEADITCREDSARIQE
jgi:hypothetical protein